MGEVGTNSSENPTAELKMNGGLNGNCDDEPMEVDSQDNSQASCEASTKISEVKSIISDVLDNKTADNVQPVTPKDDDDDVGLSNQSADKLAVTTTEKSENNENGDKNDKAETINTNVDNHEIDSSKKTVTDAAAQNVQQIKDDSKGDVDTGSDKIVSASNGDTPDKNNIKNGSSVVLDDEEDDEIEHIPEVQEVHNISDSEDDESKSGKDENPLGDIDDRMEVDGKTGNGGVIEDDDKPFSIHSDSDTENDAVTNNDNNGNDEVHEILSDKEDCVVIEDDKRLIMPINSRLVEVTGLEKVPLRFVLFRPLTMISKRLSRIHSSSPP